MDSQKPFPRCSPLPSSSHNVPRAPGCCRIRRSAFTAFVPYLTAYPSTTISERREFVCRPGKGGAYERGLILQVHHSTPTVGHRELAPSFTGGERWNRRRWLLH